MTARCRDETDKIMAEIVGSDRASVAGLSATGAAPGAAAMPATGGSRTINGLQQQLRDAK